jgi:hypothetical protein
MPFDAIKKSLRTRKTLCAMVKAGDIPAIRCGRDNLFESWDLALWLEDRQLGGRPHASGKHERTSYRQGSKAGAGGRYPDAAKPHPLYKRMGLYTMAVTPEQYKFQFFKNLLRDPGYGRVQTWAEAADGCH